MNNSELKELIIKITKTKDKNAFSKIFYYFAPRIIGYLISSGTNKEISEEITQEVLSNVWQKAYQFDQKKANVSTWIFTIARNKRIDRIRKNENPTYNSIDLINTLYPSDNEKNQELQEKIDEILSSLNKNEKKLIKMNFFEGKTHKTISEVLKIPLGTVKSRIRGILQKIKNSDLG